MSKSTACAALALLTVLPACTTPAAPKPCPVADYQDKIGTPVAALSLPRGLKHRIIGPDTMVTMDYLPERMNVMTDKDGVITDLTCG